MIVTHQTAQSSLDQCRAGWGQRRQKGQVDVLHLVKKSGAHSVWQTHQLPRPKITTQKELWQGFMLLC